MTVSASWLSLEQLGRDVGAKELQKEVGDSGWDRDREVVHREDKQALPVPMMGVPDTGLRSRVVGGLGLGQVTRWGRGSRGQRVGSALHSCPHFERRQKEQGWLGRFCAACTPLPRLRLFFSSLPCPGVGAQDFPGAAGGRGHLHLCGCEPGRCGQQELHSAGAGYGAGDAGGRLGLGREKEDPRATSLSGWS